MASKRIGLLTGGMLAGALLLGTAGLVAAQDPASTPTPSPSRVGPGGMTVGQMGAGMTGGQNGVGQMGSQMSGQMGSQMGSQMSGQMGAGMMGSQMSAAQLKQMATLHDEMVNSGANVPAQMQAFHAQHHRSR